ncbi:MAG: SDR family NAD(P)-dependent oxidoreductase [Mycobacterium sp.]
MTEDLLARRRAVVVGGSRGIGREVAHLLAALGAGVVVNGRDGDAVAAVVAEITDTGGRAAGFTGSPSDADTAAALIGRCTETFGAPDVLVNCAGIPEPAGSSILTVTAEQFQAQLDSHLMTVFHTCRAAAPIMVDQGRGAIVNTSSFAFLGDYGGTGYPAGKGAVNGLTLAIAAELREHGIRANVVCPGAKTRISSGPDYEEQIEALRRRGLLDEATARASLDAPPPEYAAPLYAYLASDLAEGITGQILVAAGGFAGRFDRPAPALLGYRDHADSPPWTLPEIDAMIRR